MWPWQQPTSSTHPHYASSSPAYHHPQAPQHLVSPHTLPPSQFPAPQHYLYPPANPAGEFPFSSHLSDQVPVDTWAESRQPSVQSDSISLPFSSTLQPRPEVHLPTLHPSQQATPTNVQPPQPSPLPLTPSHPPPSHAVTQSPFSMDFILREHATPTPNGAELAPPVVQYQPTATGPTQTDLSDPVVAPGYQSGMGDVMYQTPPQPHPQMPHPHTPSPQLQSSLSQGYAEGGRVKSVTFDPTSRYGDQSKRAITSFGSVTGTDESVAQFSPAHETSFPDSIQPFQLHSNYHPPSSGEPGKIEMGGGSEAPYSPPELIPEHQGGGNQSDSLNQSHDICPPELAKDHNGSSPIGGEEPNSHLTPILPFNNSALIGGGSAEQNRTKIDQNVSKHSTTAMPRPPTPPTPGSRGLQIDVKEQDLQEREPQPVPPSHLPLRRSVSPLTDDLDIRPSAPRPPPLVRRGRGGHSSDEEDDVFLPAQSPPPALAPTSPPAPSPPSPPPHTSPPPPPQPPSANRDSEEEESEKMETMATTPSEILHYMCLVSECLFFLLPSDGVGNSDNETRSSEAQDIGSR